MHPLAGRPPFGRYQGRDSGPLKKLHVAKGWWRKRNQISRHVRTGPRQVGRNVQFTRITCPFVPFSSTETFKMTRHLIRLTDPYFKQNKNWGVAQPPPSEGKERPAQHGSHLVYKRSQALLLLNEIIRRFRAIPAFELAILRAIFHSKGPDLFERSRVFQTNQNGHQQSNHQPGICATWCRGAAAGCLPLPPACCLHVCTGLMA
jgi:hypothetical protein